MTEKITEKITGRLYQNFDKSIDEEKEKQAILAILETGEYTLPYWYKENNWTLYEMIDAEYVLAYRMLLEEGEEVALENLVSMRGCNESNVVFNYYTDDIEAIKEDPYHYLSENYDDLYDEDGCPLDYETGERLEDEEKLSVDLNHCYVIGGWTYEVRY